MFSSRQNREFHQRCWQQRAICILFQWEQKKTQLMRSCAYYLSKREMNFCQAFQEFSHANSVPLRSDTHNTLFHNIFFFFYLLATTATMLATTLSTRECCKHSNQPLLLWDGKTPVNLIRKRNLNWNRNCYRKTNTTFHSSESAWLNHSVWV